MSGYILAPLAKQDLDEISDFIRDDRPGAAQQVILDIEHALQRLAEFPRAGHVRPELAPSDTRFWTVHPYLVIYRADVSPIEVLRVVSGYRDLVDVIAWGVSEKVDTPSVLASCIAGVEPEPYGLRPLAA